LESARQYAFFYFAILKFSVRLGNQQNRKREKTEMRSGVCVNNVNYSALENFFNVPLHIFGSTSTISRFGERFRDGQYSLVSFFFAVLLLRLLPSPVYPSFIKVEARASSAYVGETGQQ